MVKRKKVTPRRKKRPVTQGKRYTRRIKYFKNPEYEAWGEVSDPDSLPGQLYHFSKKVLMPAYNEFTQELDTVDDEDERKRIIADYAYLAGAKKIGSERKKNEVIKEYLDDHGNILWNKFTSDVRARRNLFDPNTLSQAKKQSDIPGQSILDRAMRRLVLRQTGYGVVDEGITNTFTGEQGRPKLGILGTDQAKGMYDKLVGPIKISVPKTDKKATDRLFGKGLEKFLRSSHSSLSDSDIRWLKRIYPDASIGEAFKNAREKPESFKQKMLTLRNVEGRRFDHKKLFYDIVGEPYSDPEGFEGFEGKGSSSGKYDKSLAKAFNKALGLSQGSMNPMAIGAALKWGDLKTEHGLSNEEILRRAEGEDLEGKYILEGSDKLGKKRVRKKALEKRAKKMGWNIVGIPDDTSYSKSKKKKSSSGSSGSSYSSTSSSGTPTSKPKQKSWLSKKQVKIAPSGQFVWQKSKGALSDLGKKSRRKIKKKISPSAKEREKYFIDEFGETYPKDFIDDAKRKMREGNWVQRRLLEHQAKRMAYDVDYRGKKLAEKELDRGIAAAKYAKAQKQAEAVQKAATSPFYAAWHRFSLITKWVIVLGIAAAVLFLPVGMFYVLGWALAVGIVALIQFIVWVFMEIWLLLAQSVVTIVSLVGQAFTFVINWIGRSFAGLTGGEYAESSFLNVQDMLMFNRLEDGSFVVSTYTDETGARQLLTWGQLNLTPPSFLSLDEFRPETFDTSSIIAYIFPPIKNFFTWVYGPIADRYTAWISNPATPWYWPGVVVGVPIILAILAITLGYLFLKKKTKLFV